MYVSIYTAAWKHTLGCQGAGCILSDGDGRLVEQYADRECVQVSAPTQRFKLSNRVRKKHVFRIWLQPRSQHQYCKLIPIKTSSEIGRRYAAGWTRPARFPPLNLFEFLTKIKVPCKCQFIGRFYGQNHEFTSVGPGDCAATISCFRHIIDNELCSCENFRLTFGQTT